MDRVQTAPSANRLVGWVDQARGFLTGVRDEMRKVTWPEVPDVRRATIAIIVFVLLLGLLIYVLDAALGLVLVNLIPKLFAGGR